MAVRNLLPLNWYFYMHLIFAIFALPMIKCMAVRNLFPLYWYFLHAFNFRYFRAPHDCTKITSFK